MLYSCIANTTITETLQSKKLLHKALIYVFPHLLCVQMSGHAHQICHPTSGRLNRVDCDGSWTNRTKAPNSLKAYPLSGGMLAERLALKSDC